MYGIAMRIGDDLKFDVTWLFEKLLHVHRVVAECCTGFCFGYGDSSGE